MSTNPQSCTKHQKHQSSPSPTAPCCDSQCTAGPLLHTPHCCAAAVPVCDRRILTRRVCSATSADSPTTAQACWYHTAGSARAATHKAPCPCAHPHTARSRPSLATPPTHSSAPHAAAVATLAYYAHMHSKHHHCLHTNSPAQSQQRGGADRPCRPCPPRRPSQLAQLCHPPP